MNRLLAIYLNDHLAGATAGLELARRALQENGENDYGRFLSTLAEEIDQDRRTLIEVMERLTIPRSKVKVPAAWVLEKVGRLKLNGRNPRILAPLTATQSRPAPAIAQLSSSA